MPGIGSVLRWAAVFAGATMGSWAGRIAAARLYGEPVQPLMRLDARVLLNQDVAPGFLAAELLGKALRLGLTGEAVLAAGGAALSAIVTGPVVKREP